MRSVSKKYDLKISIFSVYYIDIDPEVVELDLESLAVNDLLVDNNLAVETK